MSHAITVLIGSIPAEVKRGIARQDMDASAPVWLRRLPGVAAHAMASVGYDMRALVGRQQVTQSHFATLLMHMHTANGVRYAGAKDLPSSQLMTSQYHRIDALLADGTSLLVAGWSGSKLKQAEYGRLRAFGANRCKWKCDDGLPNACEDVLRPLQPQEFNVFLSPRRSCPSAPITRSPTIKRPAHPTPG